MKGGFEMNKNLMIALIAAAVLAVAGVGMLALSNREEAPMDAMEKDSGVEMTEEATTSTEGAMMEEAPMEEAPMDKTPMEEAPMSETPMDKTPMEKAPMNETPMKEAPMKEAPMEETPMAAPTEPMVMNPGKAAPAFELKDIQGNTHSLADYQGQKVYIKFWASWCSICLAGLEDVNALAAEDQDFAVLTVVSPEFSGEQSREDFIRWYTGLDAMSQTVLLDDGGAVARAYGVRAYPTSAYIGSDGILVKSLPGHRDNDGIKETFEGIK